MKITPHKIDINELERNYRMMECLQKSDRLLYDKVIAKIKSGTHAHTPLLFLIHQTKIQLDKNRPCKWCGRGPAPKKPKKP